MNRLSECEQGTNLNSIWLEGEVLTSLWTDNEPSSKTPGRFRIRSLGRDLDEQASEFVVETTAQAMRGLGARLGKGHNVRIIGRLHQRRWQDPLGEAHEEVRIVGEWVEPQPLLV